jgi:hypothetical protein
MYSFFITIDYNFDFYELNVMFVKGSIILLMINCLPDERSRLGRRIERKAQGSLRGDSDFVFNLYSP